MTSIISFQNKMSLISVCLILLTLFPGCNKVEYPDTGDLPDNFHDLVIKAKKGDVDAQFDLGVEYLKSKYFDKNSAKALSWFIIAANNGDAEAMYNIGTLYHRDNKVGIDIKKAIYWYEKAANLSISEAAFNLSIIYSEDSQYKNIDKEFHWSKRAAELGYARAMHNVAVSYSTGRGVEQNQKIAFDYFKQAAINGSVTSMFVLGKLYEEGKGVNQDLVNALAWKIIAMDLANIHSDLHAIQVEMNNIDRIKSKLNQQEIEMANNLSKEIKLTLK